jgi:hypothetical protein
VSPPVVYHFPDEFPFRIRIENRSRGGGREVLMPQYALIRSGSVVGEITMSWLGMSDMVELRDAINQELDRR